jgi:hypothetical protein
VQDLRPAAVAARSGRDQEAAVVVEQELDRGERRGRRPEHAPEAKVDPVERVAGGDDRDPAPGRERDHVAGRHRDGVDPLTARLEHDLEVARVGAHVDRDRASVEQHRSAQHLAVRDAALPAQPAARLDHRHPASARGQDALLLDHQRAQAFVERQVGQLELLAAQGDQRPARAAAYRRRRRGAPALTDDLVTHHVDAGAGRQIDRGHAPQPAVVEQPQEVADEREIAAAPRQALLRRGAERVDDGQALAAADRHEAAVARRRDESAQAMAPNR